MGEVLRNMFRRKVRTFLTIFGIMIGIFALTVMGALAIKLNKSIHESKQFLTSQITIAPKGLNGPPSSAAFLSTANLAQVKTIPGVDEVRPVVNLTVDDNNGLSFNSDSTIQGIELTGDINKRAFKGLQAKSGRLLNDADIGKIVIGTSVAVNKKWSVGQTVTIRATKFEIVGILDKTEGPTDNYVFMPITDARKLLIESNQFLKSLQQQSQQASQISAATLASLPAAQRTSLRQASAFDPNDVASAAAIYWKSGVDPEALAVKIKDRVTNLTVYSPHDFAKVIDQASVTINLIILGSAAIALIVGSLSVINTMIMSISERTREIGIKRAIGARTRNILFDYLVEAAMIGLFGGVLGLAAGWVTTYLVNKATENSGTQLFAVTPELAFGVVGFAVLLGVVAGFYPAIHAARINPVKALRSE